MYGKRVYAKIDWDVDAQVHQKALLKLFYAIYVQHGCNFARWQQLL